jgi:diadenosine tetraphosphate (Ap4A) HIT family hydrolase
MESDSPYDQACFICRIHQGLEAAPPGGYLYEDAHWLVCHAPTARAIPREFFVASRRHWVDFTEMTPSEGATLSPLLRRLYATVKCVTGAEGVYLLSTVDGVPHFQAWLVPRMPGGVARGVEFLAKERCCTEDEAVATVQSIRSVLASKRAE